MRTKSCVSVLSCVILVGTVSAAFAQAPTARLYDVKPARGVSAGQPVGETEAFDPATNPIYVWFRQENVRIGQTISARWFFDEPEPPDLITQAAAQVDSPSGWGQFNIEMPPGKSWPPGRYHVELMIDGRSAAIARFRVGAAGGSREPRTERGSERSGAPSPSVYTHPRAGYQFAPPPGWSVDDRAQTADVQLKSPSSDALIEITSGPVSRRLEAVSYAAGWESVMVGPGRKLKAKRAGHELEVDGEPAYEGTYADQGVVVKAVFFSTTNRFFVVTGVFGGNDFTSGEPVFDRMMSAFRTRR